MSCKTDQLEQGEAGHIPEAHPSLLRTPYHGNNTGKKVGTPECHTGVLHVDVGGLGSPEDHTQEP